jgi:hypothetical protein
MPGNKKNRRKSAQTKKAATAVNPTVPNPNAFDPKAAKGGKGGGAVFAPKAPRKSSQRGR